MTGSLWELALAAVVFVGSHMGLSARAVRDPLVRRLGEGPFLGLYSVVAGITMAWMILAYVRAPYVALWPTTNGLRDLALAVMPMSCILVAGGYIGGNPTAVGQTVPATGRAGGMAAITRHPVMWGIALWAIVHIAVNGDVAVLILAGAVGILALAGTVHIDRRRARRDPEAWRRFAAETSNLPFLAALQGRARFRLSDIGIGRVAAGLVLYVGLLVVHPWIFGMPALP